MKFGLKTETIKAIQEILAGYPEVDRAIIYGSRAKGNYRPGSDIDLTLTGEKLTLTTLQKIENEIDDLLLPYKVDLSLLHHIQNVELLEHIERVGKVFYERNNFTKAAHPVNAASDNEYKNTTMSEWKEYKLGDVIETNRKSIESNYPYRSILYLDTGSITCNRIELLQELELKNAPSRAKRLIDNDDIIYSTVRPNQLHYGIIKNPPKNLVVSTGFVTITCRKETIEPLFLFYNLTQAHITEYLHSIAEASTSAYPSLKPSDIESLEIFLPPLPEQRAIAEVLSSLDDKIDLLHRQNKTLEQLAETLFRQWFVEEAEESWEESTFGNLVKPKKGKNLTKSEAVVGEYPVVAGGVEPSCYHNEANTKSPVITISASGANAGYVRLYHTPVWSSDSSYIDETITPYVYFSYVFLKTNQRQLTDKQEGSAQPHIYPSHIMELEMLKYPEKLIDAYEKEVTPLFQKIKSNTRQIRTLTQLRDTLLPKLMAGEIRVKLR